MALSVEASDLLRVGVILVGLSVLAKGLVSIVAVMNDTLGVALLFQPELDFDPFSWSGAFVVSIVMSIFQVVFGALFVLQSRRVAAWLWRLDEQAPAVD
ncbi:MAG: hypothetical protein H5T75_04445 [Coriobacteriia bacterium]|nr:hypothetical protein [Coriobacteriia bacterium]GAV31068.1 hypothetical protein emb_1d0304 [Coriobacteriaceae bacterium EMTCatB1]